jgi:hypothetical protein
VPASARRLEGAVVALTLAFATAALGGLAITALGFDLTLASWSVLAGVVLVPVACVAAARVRPRSLARPRVSPVAVVIVLAAGAALSAAGVVAVSSQRDLDRRRSTTQLAVVPAPEAGSIQVYVRNTAGAPGRYRLRIDAPGRRIDVPLTLAPGQTWSGLRSVGGPATVRLFRDDRPQQALRSVTLP